LQPCSPTRARNHHLVVLSAVACSMMHLFWLAAMICASIAPSKLLGRRSLQTAVRSDACYAVPSRTYVKTLPQHCWTHQQLHLHNRAPSPTGTPCSGTRSIGNLSKWQVVDWLESELMEFLCCKARSACSLCSLQVDLQACQCHGPPPLCHQLRLYFRRSGAVAASHSYQMQSSASSVVPEDAKRRRNCGLARRLRATRMGKAPHHRRICLRECSGRVPQAAVHATIALTTLRSSRRISAPRVNVPASVQNASCMGVTKGTR